MDLCQAATSLWILWKTWCLHIIKNISIKKQVSYNSIKRDLPFLNGKTLSYRLKDLQNLWIIQKVETDEWIRYNPTDKLQEISDLSCKIHYIIEN